MNKYAIIKDGIVDNIVLWDGSGDLFSNEEIEDINGIACNIGWIYKDGEFINPVSSPSDSELYERELSEINCTYENDKNKLAMSFLSASLFDGDNEEKNKEAIQAKLLELNVNYEKEITSLDEKYGNLNENKQP